MASCLWSALATPALAYVDPSVMTYTIQTLVGMAVALSAVLGVVWRRARRWLLHAMHVDENAGKAVERAAHAVDANDTEAHTAADAATRKLTEPRKPFAPDLSWRSRLVLALIAALCVCRLLQEVVLNGNLPAADGTPVDWPSMTRSISRAPSPGSPSSRRSSLSPAYARSPRAWPPSLHACSSSSRSPWVSACLALSTQTPLPDPSYRGRPHHRLAKSNAIVFILDMFDTKRCS